VLTPETIESAFGVRSAIYREPVTGALAISLIEPAAGADAVAHTGSEGENGRTPAGGNGVASAIRG